jgi:hypothetical protein
MPDAYRQGEHICSIHESADEQVATAADYLADGLRAGARALYVGESEAAFDRLRAALDGAGIDAAVAEKVGALLLRTHAEAHLQDGAFDSERMLAFLNEAIEEALEDGFAGLRGCGDMSWLLGDAPGTEQLLEYEAHLTRFFLRTPAAAMCQYDRRRLPPRFVNHALATHPSVVIDGVHKANGFFGLPESAPAGDGHDVPRKLAELRMR